MLLLSLSHDGAAIRDLLLRSRRIAVVGISPKADRPSYTVAAAMQRFGYQIIPVRPAIDTILGQPAVATLEAAPPPIDIVNVFRAPEHVDAIVDSAIALGLPALWLQEGVVNRAAAERAVAAGMTVVMDRCIYRDYLALMGE
jgi:uncharacterized protein